MESGLMALRDVVAVAMSYHRSLAATGWKE